MKPLLRARNRLITTLGGVPRAERAEPPGRSAVAAWIAAECLRDAEATFPLKAAFVACRRYQADRLAPMPSRRDFVRACRSLGLRREDGGPLVGVRPKDPAVLETAPVESITEWLGGDVDRAPDAAVDAQLAWASYARSVAPRMPSPRFAKTLGELGITLERGWYRGIAL